MPFRETVVTEERVAMFREYDTGYFSVSELAARYGVSRESFYVWKRRRESSDAAWFCDRGSVPGGCPHRTDEVLAAAVVAMRRRFPRFGPKKLRAKLLESDPLVVWPAASTMGDIIKRAGLVEGTRRHRRQLGGEIVAGAVVANDEWSMDFKGWFRTRNGERIDPLTVVDTASRYVLSVQIAPPTYAGVRAEMERLFGKVGLPLAIRSDNGQPFGSPGAGGLSRLSAWLLRLGIDVRFIPPGSPQDNGRHERMHRELKAETARKPSASAAEQQARFDDFRVHYNQERPHEALEQTPPIRHWQPSSRVLPAEAPTPWYDAEHDIRTLRSHGAIRWRNQEVFISEALAGEQIGIRELENGSHLVRFCSRDLGLIQPDLCFLRFAPPRARLRSAKET